MNKKSTLLILVAISFLSSCTPRQEEQPPEESIKESCFYHTVKYSGETLAAISGWYTGSISNWPTILAANEGMNERRITLGTDICIPSSLVIKDKPFPKPNFRVQQEKTEDLTPEEKPTSPLQDNETIQEKKNTTSSIEEDVRNTLMQGSEMPTEQLAPTPAVVKKPVQPVKQDEDELRKTRERLLREMLLDE